MIIRIWSGLKADDDEGVSNGRGLATPPGGTCMDQSSIDSSISDGRDSQSGVVFLAGSFLWLKMRSQRVSVPLGD
jgi:hypothetical protein